MKVHKRDVVGLLKRLWRERRPMVLAVFILVVGIPVVVALAVSSKPKQSPVVSKAILQAQKSTSNGDYTDAYNKLKATESLAVTKQQKADFYAQMAAAASNIGKITEAINYLKLRHQIDPSTAKMDAEMMGSLYERAADKADAVAQYKLALEYYQSLPSNINNSSTIEGLKSRIADLEAGQ